MGAMQLFESLAHFFHPRRSNNHRPRLLHPEVLLYVLVIATVFSALVQLSPKVLPSLSSVLGYASNITIEQIIALTNQERAQLGLQQLEYSPVLSQAAAAKGSDMFAEQYWAHTSPSGKEPWSFMSEAGYTYRVAGENLARDFAVSDQVVAAWMASPTHRANIVNGSYREIGVAVVNGVLDGMETTLVVQMFGTPRNPVAEVLPPAQITTTGSSAEQPSSEAPSPAELSPDSEAPNSVAGDQVSSEDGFSQLESTLANEQSGAPEVAPSEVSFLPSADETSVVLGGVVVPATVLASPLISPLQLSKAFFLSIVLLLVGTLSYDFAVMESRKTVRLVGKNLAHIMLFMLVAFLVVFFRGGVVG